MCRSDASINFNWGSGSPSTAIPRDRFSARWTRTVNFTAGTHRFALGSDDGSRLYIDGVLVLDRWAPQGYPNPVPTVDRSLQAGNHTIVVEYFENYGGARATMEWTKQSNSVTATATVAGDHRWYGENRIALTNTSTITAMTVTPGRGHASPRRRAPAPSTRRPATPGASSRHRRASPTP